MPPESVRVRSSLLLGQRERLEQLLGALAALALGHPEVAAVVVERLLDRQEPVEVELLRREPDRRAGLLVVVDRVVAEDPDLPDVGCARPVVQWISVDLPAPFGPSRPKNSPPRSPARRSRSASTPVG